MIKYSVIMPAFNSEKTIEKTIQSILRQTISDWELIVVDDESVDKTGNIVQSYSEKHKNILYFRQKNGGPGVARNRGIKESKGKYICFLDSDDYWSDDFLTHIDGNINDTQADIIYYDIVRESVDGKPIGYSKPSRFKNKSKEELLILQGSGTLEWGMTKVIKASLIKEHNIEFSDLPVGEEAIFSLEILRYANNVSFVEKDIYHYVDSNTSQHNSGDLDPWYEVVKAMKNFLSNTTGLNNDAVIINNLSLKALTINVNRICLSRKFKQARREIKESVLRYKNECHGIFTCKKKQLEPKVWVVKNLLNSKLYFAIFCLSRIRG